MTHIDKLAKLKGAPGYNAATDQFIARFYGGEEIMHCWEQALLVFFDAMQGKHNDATCELFNCFQSGNPTDQLAALEKLRPFPTNPASYKPGEL